MTTLLNSANNTKELVENVENICKFTLSHGIARDQAEQQIQAFYKTSQPYELFFSVLRESKSSISHFYMLMGIREASIREWAVLDSMSKLKIIDFLYQYISNLNSMTFLEKHTRTQSYTALAVICKRSWLDTDKYQQGLEMNQIIMEKIYSDLNSNQFHQMEAAVQMIHSIIIEFSSKSNSARINLTWEFHMKCLVSFQSLHLQPIFRKIMEILFHLKEPQSNNLIISMLNLSLKIICDILEWKFADKGIASLSFLASFSTVQYSLRPTAEWTPLFINKSSDGKYSSPILDLLFSLYPNVRNHSTIPSLLRTSYTQLATLTGPVTKDYILNVQYLNILLEKVTPILEMCIQAQNWTEMQDISHLIHRLCLNFKFSGILSIGNVQLMIGFIQNIRRFIFSALQLMKTSMERGDEDLESEIELDCLDILLRAWLALINDIEEQIRRKKADQFEFFKQVYQVFLQCSQEIYREYIKTRLELSKLELARFDQLEPDNDDNNELNEDKNKYNDQLKSISYIGRITPIHAMDMLTNEILRTTELLKTQSDPYLFESLHWMILFSGHLLFDMDNSILAAIPNTVEQESYNQYSQTQGSRDSIIDLTNAIFKYSFEYENTLLKNGLINQLSPLTSKTAMWFFAGWSLVYLSPSDTLNVQVSPKLKDAFGAEQNISVICDNLIMKILLNLKYWSGDNDLLQETCQLFYNLSSHGRLIKPITQSKYWPTLFLLNEPGFEKLPPHTQSQLYKATTNIIFKLGTPNEIKNAFAQFTQSLVQQLDSILKLQNFETIAQDAIVKENLYIIFEKLKGILCAPIDDLEIIFERSGAFNQMTITPQDISTCQCLPFDLFMTYANSLIAMLSIYDHYNDVVQIILSVFSNFTKYQITIDADRARNLYNTIINLFQAVSKITNTKNPDNHEYYHRIKVLIKILYNIITYNDPQNQFPMIIAKTIFNGINVVTPCLTNKYNLLQYPKLARNYFMVLTYIFNQEDISDIHYFPVEISNSIFRLVDSGLLHHDLEIVKGCFECISGLTDFSKKLKANNLSDRFDFAILNQYIGSVINFLLLHDFNVDEILSTASDCLFNLMINSYEGYKTKIIELINRQDQSNQQILLQAFETLVITDTNRKAKDEFLQKLKNLLEKVKPLLKKQ